MKNKKMKKYIGFLVSFLGCIPSNDSLAAQGDVEQQTITALEQLLFPDNIQADGINNIFTYVEKNEWLAPKREIIYNQSETRYGSNNVNNIYQNLYSLVSQLVPNAGNEKHITSDMWMAAADLYLHKCGYFLKYYPSNKNQSNSNGKLLTIDWGEAGGRGRIPTKLAILIVFCDVLKKNIIKETRETPLFSREGISSSFFVRTLWPNLGTLSKKISSLKILEIQIANELTFYINNLSPKKLKDLEHKARNDRTIVSGEWSSKRLADEISKQIDIIEKQGPQKLKGKKSKNSFFNGWIFKLIVVLGLAFIGFITYIATLGPKNTNKDTDEIDEPEEDDDDEFDEE